VPVSVCKAERERERDSVREGEREKGKRGPVGMVEMRIHP
jgi:hypothetical protein